MTLSDKHAPFWILTGSILIILTLPILLQDGMFMDGLLYACVSKNLSEGIGNFWFPHYSITTHKFFDQQPPLGFWIQSMFFTLFGNTIYVERGYSFLSAIITAVLIVILWRMIYRGENEIKKLGWLPVLFWITIPVCFWAYSNNMLENTMGIFDLIAIMFVFRCIQSFSFLYVILLAIFIFLASLTKGFQGMFPCVAILIGWIVYRNISFAKMLSSALLLIFILSAIYFSLLQNDDAFQSLSTYFHNRVLNSIQNIVAVENRFYMIYRLFLELMPMLIFIIIILLLRKREINSSPSIVTTNRHVLFFLLVGISASFPLIVTLEQRGFYLVTSFPYFALAGASFAAPSLSTLIEKINLRSRSFKWFQIISIVFFTVSMAFSFMQIGKTSRDKEILHDIYLIGKAIPKGTVVGSTYELWRNWSFQEYLIRHFYVCLDNKITRDNDYVILESGTIIHDSIKVEKVNIPTLQYHLYKTSK